MQRLLNEICWLRIWRSTFMANTMLSDWLIRPALRAMWSKALPLTASCLSSLSGFESPETCEKVASDLRSICFLPGTPVASTSYNWLVTT